MGQLVDGMVPENLKEFCSRTGEPQVTEHQVPMFSIRLRSFTWFQETEQKGHKRSTSGKCKKASKKKVATIDN